MASSRGFQFQRTSRRSALRRLGQQRHPLEYDAERGAESEEDQL